MHYQTVGMGKRGKQKFAVAMMIFAQLSYADAGEVAAGVLQGTAQIINSVGQIAVPAIQAKADVQIAKINADTAITTTEITADTSKELATIQKDISIYQALTAQEINETNQDAQTQRLAMQLAELRAAREDASASEREKRRIEMMYNDQRLELAKKQAEDSLKLAKLQLNASLAQAGLIRPGGAINSAAGITVTNILAPASTVGQQSTATPAATAVASTSGTAAVRYNRRGVTLRSVGGRIVSNGQGFGRSAISNRLLGGVASSTPSTIAQRMTTEEKTISRSLASVNLIGGSTSASRVRGVKPQSDLSQFRRAPVVLAESQDYARREVQPLPEAGGHSGRGVRE